MCMNNGNLTLVCTVLYCVNPYVQYSCDCIGCEYVDSCYDCQYCAHVYVKCAFVSTVYEGICMVSK